MPTILRTGPYRFFFYASDRDEPPHIHIEHDDKTAKFWLSPIRLHRSNGFSSNELNKIQHIIQKYENTLIEAWNDFFGH